MGKTSKFYILACFGVLSGCLVELTGGTDCYVCYSWKDQGCEEDYILQNVTLSTCGAPPLSPSSSSYWRGDRERDQEYRDRLLNAPPTTCLKEVIFFIDPPIRTQNDRYNRFNRPWVERKCGFPIQAGYRQGRDLIDDCEETEVTIEGIKGIKRSCSCSTDGCNSAPGLKWTGGNQGILLALMILLVSVSTSTAAGVGLHFV